MEPIIVSEESSRVSSWSALALIAGLFLLPIAAVPLSWFPFELTKLTIFTLALSVAAILFLVASFKRNSIAIPRNWMLGIVLVVPVLYLISSLLSQNASLSYVGQGTDVDTLFFVCVCAVTTWTVSLVLGTRRMLSNAYSALYFSLFILGLFQLFQVVFGPNLFGIDALASLTSNIFGKWNDFGIAMGLLAVLSVANIDISKPSMRGTVLYVLGLALSIFLLAAVNLDSAWQALVGASVLIAVGAFLGRRKVEVGIPAPSLIKSVPVASLIVLIISIVFVVWGNSINLWLTNQLALSTLEVRPSIDATMQIGRATYAQSTKTMLFGTGPSTFVEQWLANKPVEVNASQFWGYDFRTGSGVIPTAFITTGVLGGLSWIVVMLGVLFMLLKALFRPAQDPYLRMIQQGSLIGSLFVFVTLVLYTGNQALTLLAFTLIGVAIATSQLIHNRTLAFAFMRKSDGGEFTQQPSRGRMLVAYIVLLLVLIAPVSALSFSSHRALANYYGGQALAAGDANDLARAEEKGMKTLEVYRSDTALRFLANVKAVEARNIITAEGAQTQERADKFNAAYKSALEYGQASINEFPRNYQNWLLMGQLFEALMPLNIQGAYDSARQGYVEAIKRNPRNPGLYLAAARMEATAGNEQGVIDAVRQAITLKPNYTEAALFIVQLEVARNNIDGAIQAATAAVSTAPQNAGIWFQLGLLYYVKGNAENAAEAMSQALRLVPEYANAKYFLGLTLEKMNRRADAVTLFEELAASNPDNAEVKLILNNLRAGKDPFDGAKPPVTPNPEKRPEPPIEE